MSCGAFILGDQLFPKTYLNSFKSKKILMVEDRELCTHFRYHKLKLVYFLSAMRHYYEAIDKRKFDVEYHPLDQLKKKSKSNKKLAPTGFEHSITQFIKKNKITQIESFEINDTFFREKLKKIFRRLKIDWLVYPTPMFVTSRTDFSKYLEKQKRPFMKTFYEERRKETGVLMKNAKPVQGKFSFDQENRKKLPKKIEIPEPPLPSIDKTTKEVIQLVNEIFPNHPGNTEQIWFSVDRKGALEALKRFIGKKLDSFGNYQDALSERSPFLFHSILSPYLNSGLLTPAEVIKEVEKAFNSKKIPINSAEGYLRQVLGWREFLKGIYDHYENKMEKENFWNHKRHLKSCWYTGDTGLPPVDYCIKKANKYAYCHHIERLMVLSNVMNLCEISPKEVYRWFMELFIDSADWVMMPNVYGMGLMSVGPLFATKPYVSGSNYILKMSHYSKNEVWTDIWDGLYWRFIDKNQNYFKSNPRMSMMLSHLKKMDLKKKKRLLDKATTFIETVTSG